MRSILACVFVLSGLACATVPPPLAADPLVSQEGEVCSGSPNADDPPRHCAPGLACEVKPERQAVGVCTRWNPTAQLYR